MSFTRKFLIAAALLPLVFVPTSRAQFVSPNAASAIVGTVAPANGGTGVANTGTITVGGNLVTGGALTFADLSGVGELLYTTSARNVGGLADVATGSVLISGGVGIAPAWATKVALGGATLGTNTLAATGTVSLANTALAPTSIVAGTQSVSIGLGNNTNYYGVSAGYFQAQDDVSVAAGTKGVLLAVQATVVPRLPRTNSPNDDATAFIAQNGALSSTNNATDAFYVGHNSVFTAGATEFAGGAFLNAANVGVAFGTQGTMSYGVDLCYAATCSTITSAAMRAPNNSPFQARNAAGSGDVEIARVNASNLVSLGGGAVLVDTATTNVTFAGSPQASVNLGSNFGASATRWNVGYFRTWNSNNGSNQWNIDTGLGASGDGNMTFAHSGSTVLTLGSSSAVTLGGGLNAPSLATSSAATTGTLCWTTGTGLVNVDTTVACLASDERLKDISGPVTGALAEIMELQPMAYGWKTGTSKALDDPGEHIGLGAFATAYADERLIARGADGQPRAWRQDAMIALLVAAVKEQQAEIKDMRAQLGRR